VPLLGPCLQYASACPLHTSAADHFNPKGLCGFVFDIDGVLTRGRDVLQPAKEAFQKVLACKHWDFRWFLRCFKLGEVTDVSMICIGFARIVKMHPLC